MSNDNQMEGMIMSGEKIEFWSTLETDIEYVTGIEKLPANRNFILGNTREEHISNLANPKITHLIIRRKDDRSPAGFVLLSKGDGIKTGNLELRRLVIEEKGNGFGREAVKMIKKLAFECMGVHRIWLDVFSANKVARGLYASEGFKIDGILRDCIRIDDGLYDDLVVMSILESDSGV